jgi:L-alanine-DL-glutamate epimerase-like enolase superfamily enzyme
VDRGSNSAASAQSPIPLAGCETVAWADTFQQYVEGNGLHYMMFDPSACGGIGESRRIADGRIWTARLETGFGRIGDTG